MDFEVIEDACFCFLINKKNMYFEILGGMVIVGESSLL